MKVTSRWAAAACAVVVLAGCGGEESSDLPSPQPQQPPPSVASPTVSLSPEDAAAAEEILAAVDGYFEGLVELSKEGVPGGTEETMARLEELPALGMPLIELRDDILNANFRQGWVTAGTLSWSAEVVEIDREHSPKYSPDEVYPYATLRVCIDETDWSVVDKATGEVVQEPGSRYVSTMTVAWQDESTGDPIEPGWYVFSRRDSSEPC